VPDLDGRLGELDEELPGDNDWEEGVVEVVLVTEGEGSVARGADVVVLLVPTDVVVALADLAA
jgi:hypothetical protein